MVAVFVPCNVSPESESGAVHDASLRTNVPEFVLRLVHVPLVPLVKERVMTFEVSITTSKERALDANVGGAVKTVTNCPVFTSLRV